MKRVPNWDVKLVRWAETQFGEPFEWGRTDCGSLIKSGLRLIFGQPVLDEGLRYKDEESAVGVIRTVGTVARYFTQLGGVRLIPTRAAGGDIVVRPGRDDGLPRMGLMLHPTGFVTSDPVNGPHVVSKYQLPSRARIYRMDP